MVATEFTCALCGLPSHTRITSADGNSYCCHACLEVAELLAEPGEKAPAPARVAGGEPLSFHLSGLWCSSCAWLIEEKLRRVPGVIAPRVSYLERQLRLEIDPNQLSPEDVTRRVASYGYRASPQEDQEEEERFFTRLLIGGLLAMHIMVTSAIIYVRDALGLSGPDTVWMEQFFYLMQLVVSVPLLGVLGAPILRAGLRSLRRGLPNVHSLVAIGATAALALSARNLITGHGHVYFDTAAMLFFLLTIGRWLEMKAHRKGNSAVNALTAALPETARRVTENGLEELPLAAIRRGQRIRVLPGDRVPADGRVASGYGELDESLLTGEPQPQPRSPGQPVYAGTFNLAGSFDMIVAHTGEATRAGRIQRSMHDLVWDRSPAERLADRLAAWMVYGALLIAALTFALYLIKGLPDAALLNSLSVLLIACPCALGIATPLTLRQAYNLAAEHGVLLRRSDLLERIAAVRRVFFDKTGTLTQLPYQVVATLTAEGSVEEIIRRAAALESHANHPFAEAITAFAGSDIPQEWRVEGVKTIPGSGISGELNGDHVWLGNGRLMSETNLEIPRELAEQAAACEAAGHIVLYIAWNGKVRGAVVLGERLRPEVPEMLKRLQELSLQPSILTGDVSAAGARWEQRLGIPVRAGLLPEDKLAILQNTSEPAVMVGDGINDSPALAAAAIGVALKGGAGMAHDAAEITLIGEDLTVLPWLYRLALETRRKLKQNLAWALVYNLVGMALAVAGLLQPVLAALAMVLSSAIVTQNALTLQRFTPATSSIRSTAGPQPAVPS